MENQKKQNGGITLIALVITVIVLLILAGISITMLTGENGILNQAVKAKEKTESATLQEEVTLVLNEKTTDELVEGEEKEIIEYLNKIEGATIEKNEQVGDLYYVSKNNATVSVYDDGTIYEGKIDVWDGQTVEKPEVDENNNWHIYTTGQMKFFEKYCNGELTEEEKTEANMPEITETTTVYLENNIDMGARQEDGILTTIAETQWTPIDNFEGIFEGNNHSISGIYVYDDGSPVGIFEVATVQNLTIKNSYIEATGKIMAVAGGIVGYAKEVVNCHNINTIVKSNQNGTFMIAAGGIAGVPNSSTSKIENCTNSGKILGKDLVGGTVGGALLGMYCEIDRCINTGEVIGTGTDVGGITGINYGNVTNSYNTGEITGTGERVGGIAGAVSPNGKIENCYNTGKITGESNNVGGIAGIIFGDIINSYNAGTVVAIGQVGGIVGQIGTDCEANIRECYNIGSVTGTGEAIGGIVGWTSVTDTSGTIERNYNSGQVSGTGNIGGIIGRNANTFVVTNCYNKGTVSGTTQIGSVIGVQETNSDNLSNLYYLNTLPNVAVGGKEDTGTIKSIENDFSSLEEFLNWVDESSN